MTQELSCGECRDNLLEFTAGVLAKPMREAVEQHLATCDDCRRELAFWEALGDGVRERGRLVPTDGGAAGGWARLSAAYERNRATTGTRGERVMETVDHDTGETSGGTGNAMTATPSDPTAVHTTKGQGRSTPSSGRLPRFWYVLAPTVAAMLLVALGVALFGPLRPRQAQGPGLQRASCAENQVSSAMIPQGLYVTDLAMVSPDEGWMIGYAYGTLKPGELAQHSVIWHYAHCRWAPIAEPTPDMQIYSLTMISPTEGWALADSLAGESQGKSIHHYATLHYTHGNWQLEDLPIAATVPGIGSNVPYYNLRMLSANEGWLITQDPVSDNPSSVKLFHGVGGRWEQVPVSGGHIEDMMPVAPGEAWITVATGDLAGSYRLVHYIAGKLGDSFSLSVNARFDGPIVVNTPRDLWLSAYLPLENVNHVGTSAARFLLHYDGSGWKKVALATQSGLANAASVSVFSSSDGWAFLGSTNGAQHPDGCWAAYGVHYDQSSVTGVLRLTSSGWQRAAWGLSEVGCIGNVVRAGADDYWALALHWVPDATGTTYEPHKVLLHYAEGTWRMYGDTAQG